MKITHKWIVLVTLLLAALISYAYGFSEGVAIFIVLGVIFELAFWIGAISKSHQQVDHHHY